MIEPRNKTPIDESKDIVEQIYDAEVEEPVALENFMEAIPEDKRRAFAVLLFRKIAQRKAEREAAKE